MSVGLRFELVKDSATPEMQKLAANVSPHRLAAQFGPALTKLVQQNFLNKEGVGNKKGWPPQHFWSNAAKATNWRQGSDTVAVSTNQIGVLQRLLGGDIKPINAKMLTIPAVADAYGRRAREFNPPLKLGFALDPDTGKMRLALVEAERTEVKIGKVRKDGSRAVKPTQSISGKIAIYWLARGVHQDADPTVLPTREEILSTIDTSIKTLLDRPVGPVSSNL